MIKIEKIQRVRLVIEKDTRIVHPPRRSEHTKPKSYGPACHCHNVYPGGYV
jgi:hypothetical protein